MEKADTRLDALRVWLTPLVPCYGLALESLAPASADASFRRYFRLASDSGTTYIVMDAPPEKESVGPYLKVQELMRKAGLNVPVIYEKNEEAGFILMSDLGQKTYLDVLTLENAPALFDGAVDELIAWQKATQPAVLPP